MIKTLVLICACFLVACVSQKLSDSENENGGREPAASSAANSVSSVQRFSNLSLQNSSLNQIDWRDLFYELNYINQYKMSSSQADFKNRLSNSMYYAKGGFNTAYKTILSSAKTTKEVFQNREQNLGVNEELINKLKIQAQINSLKISQAGDLINLIQSTYQNIATSPSEILTEKNNYFTTKVGAKASEILSGYTLVVIPGFGSHTIKDYSWPEIVKQANVIHGRPETRPLDNSNKFQDFKIFYGKNKNPNNNPSFDVVHPMGYELGFSMGTDVESAAALSKWLFELKKLPGYEKTKFILVGYSKGTPISLNAFIRAAQNNSAANAGNEKILDVSESIAAIVSLAGVMQGAVPANTFVKEAYEVLNVENKEQLINEIQNQQDKFIQTLNGIVNYTKKSLLITEADQKRFNEAGQLINTVNRMGVLGEMSQGVNETADQRKTIEGIIDLSNFESIQWNLKNFNDNHFDKPISIFNISMLTNVKDFVRPNPKIFSTLTPPLIVPQLSLQVANLSSDLINYRFFSKDNVFLYVTSLAGFESSPGGLFDAQVAWLDTKSMALDERPLVESLGPKQLILLQKRMSEVGISLPSQFALMPRNQLLNQIAKTQSPTGLSKNVNFVDLGEFRGTHWDVSFEQVYKPSLSNSEFYKHTFPRHALQASLIEMLAVYKKLGGL